MSDPQTDVDVRTQNVFQAHPWHENGTMTIATSGATVHLLCGYNGAGKTTYAKHLEKTAPAVRFSLDEWMLRLYPDLSYDFAAYGSLAEACKLLIWDVALQVLRREVDVVLDWNQWSRDRRATWRDNARKADFAAVLHFVDVPLELAIERSTQRAADRVPGSHLLTPDGIRNLAVIFEKPTLDEGVPIDVVKR